MDLEAINNQLDYCWEKDVPLFREDGKSTRKSFNAKLDDMALAYLKKAKKF